MFLDVTQRRNPALIDAAATLHQQGRIPSNCFVVDADCVAANTRVMSQAANAQGLVAYQMTKQFGRNPLLAQLVARNGIEKVVAVEFEEARLLNSCGLAIGNVGHLAQIPFAEVPRAVGMEPDHVTVFGYAQAERLSSALNSTGRIQPVLMRVVGADDMQYPAQRGGVRLEDVVDVASKIDRLPGLELAGVTSFPCVLLDSSASALRPTPNMETLRIASRMIKDAGIDAPEINAPGSSCASIFPELAQLGATQVEPGNSLIGHTPLHAKTDQPELPAMIYVSEVTHLDGNEVYTLGGGFYARSGATNAVIFSRSRADYVSAKVDLGPPEAIDYYGTVQVNDVSKVRVGDSAIYAFRSQVFVSRSFVAVLRDVSSDPVVLGIFHRSGFRLGDDLLRSLSTVEAS